MSTRKRIAVWQTEMPASAYLLGVLAGDGHIHIGPRTGWLVLAAIDPEFVRSFHEALVATVPDARPTVSTEAQRHPTTDPASGLQRESWLWEAKVISIELAKAVIDRYGALGTLTWRPSNVVDRFRSPELFGSWLAGLFDSDGNVTTRPTSNLRHEPPRA